MGIPLIINEDTLDEINQVYIDSRYPSDFGLLPGGVPTKKKIQKFYDFAEVLYEKVKSLINTD